MKVFLTGATGMLGTSCNALFTSKGVEVKTLNREEIWNLADLSFDPDLKSGQAFIHTAANTNVEQCELEPDACYRDNYLLTEGLARVCAMIKVPMIFISSTGVYGESHNEPYREYSQANPTTHHHRSKLLGEQAVLSASQENIVIRTGWLFGGNFANPKNFVARRLEDASKAAANGVPLFSNSEQRGCPTYTLDVATRLFMLITGGHRGLFNVVNEGGASRLDYVRAIVASAGLSIPVMASPADTFKRQAKVSSNEMAANWRAAQLGFSSMPHWKQRLNEYILENIK
jgi:dTDP-4-dehydrorhamnose reductase